MSAKLIPDFELSWYEEEDWQDDVPPPVTREEMYAELKEVNSDGRARCVACGEIIVEPYPNIRYCPKCEG